MELLKEYSEKYGVKEIVNSMGEHRKTRDSSIIFPNGWVASVIPNKGVTMYDSSGISKKEYPSNKKYSIAMCDYNGYFDWSILNEYGAIRGCLYGDTELEVIIACETIRRL